VASGGPVAIPTGTPTSTVTVTVSPNPAATTVARTDLIVVGP
jgi:hypothetical protein